MAKDPGFIFYPGDYLRDTQCLSEGAQAAYDRIMCEHMRNICISQDLLNFFTKRLTQEQKQEILLVLQKIEGGYQIEWVAESIKKRKEYSQSRRDNREGKKKTKEHINDISKSYVKHMDNENEIDNEDDSKKGVQGENEKIFGEMISDELWLAEINRLHSKKNIPEAWSECYIYHMQQPRPPEAAWEWRQKLNTWLINKKPEKEKQYDHGKNGKVRNPTAKSFGTL